jgi:hypothetical protein
MEFLELFVALRENRTDIKDLENTLNFKDVRSSNPQVARSSRAGRASKIKILVKISQFKNNSFLTYF